MNTLGPLLRDYLGEAYDVMRRSESGVRRETGPAAVHDMRVGARRMRTALRLFDRAFPSPGVHPLQADLKWLAKGLGAAHDLSLHLEALAREECRSPDPAELGAFIASVEHDYRKSLNTLHRMLLSKRYLRLMAAARDLGRRGSRQLNPELEALPARETAPELIRPWVKKCRRKARKLKTGSPDRAYHKLRILCKRTRYAIQCLGGVGPRPLTRLARRLEKMQTLLGRHQDDVVRLAALHAFLETAVGREPGPRRAGRDLLARQVRQHRKSRARIVKAVKQFAGSRILERAVKTA